MRSKVGVIVIVSFLTLLLCFYFGVPGDENSLHAVLSHGLMQARIQDTEDERAAARTVTPVRNATHDSNLLPQSVINGVRHFVFFLGHPRSGHSIVASLLDAHPHIVLAHEADVFTKVSSGKIPPKKSAIFNAIWQSTVQSTERGARARALQTKGYSLLVEGLYEGKYVDNIYVIGDKKAGTTTLMLYRDATVWSKVLNVLRSVSSVKVIHVIRNPYDNIATEILYAGHSKSELLDIKKNNKTIGVHPSSLLRFIKKFFTLYDAIENAKRTFDLDMIDVHSEEFIANPRATLLNLCSFLDVNCSDDYIDTCNKKVYKTESKTRYLVNWTDESLDKIQEQIKKYGNLHGRYDFNKFSG